eukprot:3364180-Pyramimonas_sp.AAC.1
MGEGSEDEETQDVWAGGGGGLEEEGPSSSRLQAPGGATRSTIPRASSISPPISALCGGEGRDVTRRRGPPLASRRARRPKKATQRHLDASRSRRHSNSIIDQTSRPNNLLNSNNDITTPATTELSHWSPCPASLPTLVERAAGTPRLNGGGHHLKTSASLAFLDNTDGTMSPSPLLNFASSDCTAIAALRKATLSTCSENAFRRKADAQTRMHVAASCLPSLRTVPSTCSSYFLAHSAMRRASCGATREMRGRARGRAQGRGGHQKHNATNGG